jgi:hypothetical protein
MTPEDRQKMTEILDRIDKLQARAEAAEAKVKVLTDALRPFAQAAINLTTAEDDALPVRAHTPREEGQRIISVNELHVIDFRAAARALETNNG